MKKTEKLGRIDIKATINKKKIVDIEMQINDYHNMDKRSEFYGAKLIAEQFGKNDKYEKMKPVILINILNYNMLDVPEYYTKTVTVADRHRDYEIIKDITYYFIELPKFRESKPKLANLLECWLALIDGEGELIKMAEKKNEIIKEASEEVEEILSDEELKALNDYIQTARWEENSRNYYATQKGLEEGRKKGLIEGRKEGRKEGIAKGRRQKQIEIAKKMKEKNMDIETIQSITELTNEEIENL